MEYVVALLGLVVLVCIAIVLSSNRQYIQFKQVAWGLGLQVILAVLVLGIPAIGFKGPLQIVFKAANRFVMAVIGFTAEGSKFVFGSLAESDSLGFIFAFQVLPTIIFFSSLMAVLYYLGIMQKIVNLLAVVMLKLMKASGAESLALAANIFVGQTEAPLVVKPYIAKMTKSELFTLMTGGMATVAGGVLIALVGLLESRIPGIAGHLLTASVMSAPASLAMAKIMFPETEVPATMGSIPKNPTQTHDVNLIEAATRGASEGLKMALNVGAMLLAFIALIALLNSALGLIGNITGFESWGQVLVPEILKTKDVASPLTFQLVLGWLFSPLAWLMGVPWGEATVAGSLLGEKIMLNEFVAYVHLADISASLSTKTNIILSYALCGFANFSSIAIQIGGIGEIVPERRTDLAKLGVKAMIAGSLAAFMTATIAGILL